MSSEQPTPPTAEPTPEQHTAIAQLAAAYCALVDAGDAEGLLNVFAPDAVFSFGGRDRVGRDKIVQFLATSTRGTHVGTTPLIGVAGSTATGRSRFVFVAPGAPTIAGGYEDEYTFADGRWMIARRAITIVAAPSA